MGTWRHGLNQRLWKKAAYCVACFGLLSLFPYALQDHLPRDDTTHCGLDPSTSIINQENTPITWLILVGYMLCSLSYADPFLSYAGLL